MKLNFKELLNCSNCKADLEQFIKDQDIDNAEIENLLGLYTLYCEKRRSERETIYFSKPSYDIQPLRIDTEQVQC